MLPLDLLQIFKPLLWVLPVILLIVIAKSPWFKGIIGEVLVKLVAKIRLPADTYVPIHDVTLPSIHASSSDTTQIDHIFVSKYGLFVVETKNYKGWIFGTEKQAQWTQKLYKKSYRFQNPLRQNYKHQKALQVLLDIPLDKIHSVIAFMGEATFKTPMPKNVTRGGGYLSYIKSFQDVVFSDDEVRVLVEKIEEGRLKAGRETNKRHVAGLKAR
ncbi:MAG: NERD domain-containing protein [Thalassolituus oleivorans]|uniref:nuclease-related domain-containing protein n=1 Tax=Thalassolituus oleivorans TaxID=187493 RepID=UPI001B71E42C|nr:nuclease-related domain-containing protein [Thalassolituus oleivorans]MBQ0726984.1 NERD domain-containing protein [Thalassolituus oleivorans]